MAVLTEAFVSELNETFRHDGSWLSRIADFSRYAKNKVIHLPEVGADPQVLIDNTTYPIATATRTDVDVAVTLKKFDSDNTAISRDELYALAYDKIASVVKQHREKLEEVTSEWAAHALAPVSNTANMPVVALSSDFYEDLLALKIKFDKLKIPKKDRILVMSPEHVEAALRSPTISQFGAFSRQLMNAQEGHIERILGFDVYQFSGNPLYSGGTKTAFGTTSGDASTLAIHGPSCGKAMTEIEFYYQDASTNPGFRETTAGFRLYFNAFYRRSAATMTGVGAIVG